MDIDEDDLLDVVNDEEEYLDGLTFVVSGIFENITRDNIEAFKIW